MITLGIVILLIGLVALAIGRGIRSHPAVVVGTYVAIGGAILLGIGLIFYVVESADTGDVDLDSASTVQLV